MRGKLHSLSRQGRKLWVKLLIGGLFAITFVILSVYSIREHRYTASFDRDCESLVDALLDSEDSFPHQIALRYLQTNKGASVLIRCALDKYVSLMVRDLPDIDDAFRDGIPIPGFETSVIGPAWNPQEKTYFLFSNIAYVDRDRDYVNPMLNTEGLSGLPREWNALRYLVGRTDVELRHSPGVTASVVYSQEALRVFDLGKSIPLMLSMFPTQQSYLILLQETGP